MPFECTAFELLCLLRWEVKFMAIEFPKLPYSMDALEPVISKNTLEFHYGKHHKHYVSTLNDLIRGTDMDKMELREIIEESFSANSEIFHNAAQAWNHDFYWNCMTPRGTGKPEGVCLDLITEGFGSYENFKEQFTEGAKKLFGSGWAWLVRNQEGDLSLEFLNNADNPLTQGQSPLLTCDVWEHAYYLDYQNERERYLERFWNLVNWDFVERNLHLAPRNRGEAKRAPLDQSLAT